MPTFKISEETRRELEKFKEHMRKQEYTEATTAGYSTYLSRFLRQAGPKSAGELQKEIHAFLGSQEAKHPQTFKYCRAALRLYYTMVAGGSLCGSPKAEPGPEIAGSLERFRVYSLEVKRIAPGTVASELSHVQKFLECARAQNPQGIIAELTAKDVRDYVVEKLAALTDSSKGRMITSIRNFFRCQAFYGDPVHPSILRLPLSPAAWKKSAFPTTIDLHVFDALHSLPDTNTATGIRDRCIVLCFTELALRCSEVAALTLEDFNWRAGFVTVRNTKTGADRVLPLPKSLFDALVEYLSHARPQTACRTLFVRFSHQRGEAMGCEQIRGAVRRNGAKAGLEDRSSGPHILRRTAATKLYNAGNSLKLTADILGHECLDSTTHYAKADIVGLLTVASPWPGGEL